MHCLTRSTQVDTVKLLFGMFVKTLFMQGVIKATIVWAVHRAAEGKEKWGSNTHPLASASL